jgi:hypothetical protein
MQDVDSIDIDFAAIEHRIRPDAVPDGAIDPVRFEDQAVRGSNSGHGPNTADVSTASAKGVAHVLPEFVISDSALEPQRCAEGEEIHAGVSDHPAELHRQRSDLDESTRGKASGLVELRA